MTSTVPRGVLVCLALASASCQEQGASHREQPATAAQPLVQESAEDQPAETAGPTTILISWEKSDPQYTAERIVARVENTTATARTVEVRLTGTTPHGNTIERSMGALDVPAKSIVPVEYAATDLPVQSVGVASTVAVVALYEVEAATLGPDGPGERRTLQVHTPALHATFDAGRKAAVFRDAATQGRINAAESRRPQERFTSLSVYDQSSKSFSAKDPRVRDDGTPAGVITVSAPRSSMQGPPGRKKAGGGT